MEKDFELWSEGRTIERWARYFLPSMNDIPYLAGFATGTSHVTKVDFRVHFIEAVARVADVFPRQNLQFQVDSARVEITFGQFWRKIILKVLENRLGLTYDQFNHVRSGPCP